jgi:hypothetical protein
VPPPAGSPAPLDTPARRSDRNTAGLAEAMSSPGRQRGHNRGGGEAYRGGAQGNGSGGSGSGGSGSGNGNGSGGLGGGSGGVLGGVMGTVHRLLQWNASGGGGGGGGSWDPRRGLAYYASGPSGPPGGGGGDPAASMSQPWEMLDGAADSSCGEGAGGARGEDPAFDPYQSLNLHYSAATSSSQQAGSASSSAGQASASASASAGQGATEDSFQRLLESMSRLSEC